MLAALGWNLCQSFHLCGRASPHIELAKCKADISATNIADNSHDFIGLVRGDCGRNSWCSLVVSTVIALLEIIEECLGSEGSCYAGETRSESNLLPVFDHPILVLDICLILPNPTLCAPWGFGVL